MGYEKSGYRDGIYDSLLPATPTPRNLNMTTFVLFQQENWDREALVDCVTGASVTYAELKKRVLSVASGLAQKGVKQGDVVMMCMPNSIHWPVMLLAASYLGAIVTTSNPIASIQELSRQVKDSNSSFLVTVPELWDKLAPLNLPVLLNDLDALGVRKQFHGAPHPLALMSELFRADPDKAPRVKIRDTDAALLLYSSGTTGPSKGVVLTHLNVIDAICQRLNLDLHARDPNEIEVHLVIIPLFHVMGLCVIMATLLRRSNKLIICAKFDFNEMLAAIERYKITHMGLVPPIMVALAKSPLVSKYDLSSIKVIGFGAAPSGDVSGIANRIKGVTLSQGYGMTETTGSGTTVGIDKANVEYALKHGSCGKLAPNLQAKIVDVSTGKPMPPNHEGELWLRGGQVMAGYWKNEKATAETLSKDGWLRTGDLAKIDGNGFVYIVDRLKELIKYNGFQVAPAELESVLLNHPEILDTAVVPFPDETVGEIPVAFVVRRPESSLTADAVMSFVAQQVSPYKKVRRVIFVDSIPKLESGKILRRDLKKMLAHTSKL